MAKKQKEWIPACAGMTKKNKKEKQKSMGETPTLPYERASEYFAAVACPGW